MANSIVSFNPFKKINCMKYLPGFIFLFIAVLILTTDVLCQTFTPEVREYIVDSSRTTIFRNVKIIDGRGKISKSNQTVVISAGIITRIGNASEIEPESGAFIIDCTGKTLIPGLVMMHEHMYYTMFLDSYFNLAEMPFSFPRMYLAGGATTIRTAGSIEPQTDLALKRMIKEGKLIGPDMDVTAPYIERAGFDIPSLNTVKDSKEAGTSVKFWADKGCTSFKMYMHIKKADLMAVVREAHARKMKVTGHLCTLTYREAAILGIDNLEHGFYACTDFDKNKKEGEFDYGASQRALQALPVKNVEMTDLIKFLISHKVALTSTLPVFEPYTGREIILGGGEDALLPEVKEIVTSRWKRGQHRDSASYVLFKKEMAWEKQFYSAGGLLMAGTDPTGSGRTIAGYGSRREIELLVEAGFTASEAIQIATLNGAIYLGREKKIGSIEIGKNADLVLIDGDPEANISDIRKMEIVFKNGIGYNSYKIFKSVKEKVGLN